MKLFWISPGICYKNCADQETIVPYGANMPGQIVCYKTQGNNLAPQKSAAAFDSCMPQLTMVSSCGVKRRNFFSLLQISVLSQISIFYWQICHRQLAKEIFQIESDIVKFAFFSIKCKETESVKGATTPECNFCS